MLWSMTATGLARTVSRVLIGAALIFAGLSHLLWARTSFQAQVPAWVPLDPDFVVVASGFVELALGIMLIVLPRYRVTIGWLVAGYFVAVFPGNISQFMTGTDSFGSISESPEYGQSWGDGSPFVIAYDDYTTGVLGYSISYVQEDGGAIPVTGGFFPDPVGTTFTSNDLYFNSTSDGYYGLVAVDLTTDTGTIEIGVYCVILAVSE